MKYLRFWLLEKSKIQTFTIISVVIVTIISRYLVEDNIRKAQDYYTPVVYLFLILWVYSSLPSKIRKEQYEKRNLDKNDPYKDIKIISSVIFKELIKISILIFISYKSFYIFQTIGVLVILTIITITGLSSILIWTSQSFFDDNKKNEKESSEKIIPALIFAGIIGYIFFIPWKNTYNYQFGAKEIGNYFEKHTYKARYVVEISRAESNVVEKLPADLLISDDFSEFESYDSETGVGAYSYETTKTSKIRYAKIIKVYLKNGTSLDFDNCLISINNSKGYACDDSHGNEWLIRITNEKVK
jgi:hypothetical protein